MRISKGAPSGFEPGSHDHQSNALTTRLPTAAAESTENLWYLCAVLINVYVASPNPKSAILR